MGYVVKDVTEKVIQQHIFKSTAALSHIAGFKQSKGNFTIPGRCFYKLIIITYWNVRENKINNLIVI